jgi:succinate-acetate transporter protein
MSLAILFFLLTARELTPLNTTLATLTGYEGIIVGASAIYLAIAEVLNEAHGKTVLPIGPVG